MSGVDGAGAGDDGGVGEGAGSTGDGGGASSRFVTSVVSFSPTDCAGFGVASMPGIVEGPPVGGGADHGSTDVVSLGCGGSIVVGFAPNAIVDGPGPDFIVFENPFVIGGNASDVYAEPGEVQRQRRRDDLADLPLHAYRGSVGLRRHRHGAALWIVRGLARRALDAAERRLAARSRDGGGRRVRPARPRRDARALRADRRSDERELPRPRAPTSRRPTASTSTPSRSSTPSSREARVHVARGHVRPSVLRSLTMRPRLVAALVALSATVATPGARAQEAPAEEVTVRGNAAAGFTGRAAERDAPRELTDAASLVEPLPGVHVRRFGARRLVRDAQRPRQLVHRGRRRARGRSADGRCGSVARPFLAAALAGRRRARASLVRAGVARSRLARRDARARSAASDRAGGHRRVGRGGQLRRGAAARRHHPRHGWGIARGRRRQRLARRRRLHVPRSVHVDVRPARERRARRDQRPRLLERARCGPTPATRGR